MAGSDRESGLIAPLTDRRAVVALGWLSLAALVVLSGCTTSADVSASPTTPGDPAVDTAGTAAATTSGALSASPTDSPVPTAGSPTHETTASTATSGDPTTSPTAVPTGTATATPTPVGENLTRAEARQVFVSSIESEGIAVERLELADSIWMLTYSTGHTSWSGFAAEMETITLAYCGLFERGLPMGFEGSDNLEMTVLDESGTAPAIGGWYVDPFTMCQPYLDGELTKRELMAEVFGTLRLDESN